jgi:hypothetical protein
MQHKVMSCPKLSELSLRLQSTAHKSVMFYKRTSITMNCQQNLIRENMFGYQYSETKRYAFYIKFIKN